MWESMKSTTHRYADLVLGRPLAEYVTEKRNAGISWRRISLDIRDDTAGQVDITYETLRKWFPELIGADS